MSLGDPLGISTEAILAGERDSGGIGENAIPRAIPHPTLGGFDGHPRFYPACQRLLPGRSSCPVAGRLGADVDDSQITPRVLRRAIGDFTPGEETLMSVSRMASISERE